MSEQITMYGAEWCSDCRRSKSLLDEMGVDYKYIDIEAVAAAADEALAISGRSSIPLIVFPDGSHFVEPTNADLREKVEALQL